MWFDYTGTLAYAGSGGNGTALVLDGPIQPGQQGSWTFTLSQVSAVASVNVYQITYDDEVEGLYCDAYPLGASTGA